MGKLIDAYEISRKILLRENKTLIIETWIVFTKRNANFYKILNSLLKRSGACAYARSGRYEIEWKIPYVSYGNISNIYYQC